MALIEVNVNGVKTYVNDKLDINETGVAIKNDSELEETKVNDNSLEDTMIDIYGDNND